ncbi:MAG: 50S ribosomal protein L10 [Verrucomicrobiota bacterium]
MNPDKQIIVDELFKCLDDSPFMIVTEYTGITVDQFTELRKRLRDAGSRCQVAKNSLVKKALHQMEAPDEIGQDLKGQTAIVTGEADICAAAKVLKDFAKEFEKPEVKSGVLDGKYLDPEQIKAMADLPSREVLLAQLLGVLNAPGSKLVRTINEPAAALARLLQAKADKENAA